MHFEELDEQTLNQIGTPETTARAQELVNEHQVRSGYRLVNRLLGVVAEGPPFQVAVKIQNDHLAYECSCPQAEGGELCPHVMALLWAWVKEPGAFLKQADLKERLKKYSKNELVEIILDLAERGPQARDILKEEEQGLDDILESIDRVVDEFTPDAGGVAEAESKLRRAQLRADRLAQSGRLADARSIYFYLLDSLLSLEERTKRQVFTAELKKDLFEEYCQFIHEDRHLERELVQQEIEQLESRPPETTAEMDLAEVKRELSL